MAGKKKLKENDLLDAFLELATFRQKEICRYLNNIKTEEPLKKNISKIVNTMMGKTASPLFRLK